MLSLTRRVVRRLVSCAMGVCLMCVGAQAAPGQAASAGSRDEPSSLTERVRRLSREVESLRGLRFKREPRVEVQAPVDFQRHLSDSLDRMLPRSTADRMSRALQAMGLLPGGYDLRRGIEALLVSQARAFYGLETRTLYVLATAPQDEALDLALVHELEHALQDQHFDLKAIREATLKLPEADARNAVSFLLEGEATYVMLRYKLKRGGKDVETLPPKAGDMLFRTVRNLDSGGIIGAFQPDGSAQGKGERGAADIARATPSYVFWSIFDPLFKGQYAIHATVAAKGWAGITKLIERRPASTEQMLHPEKLEGDRDAPTPVKPVELAGALGAGWTRVYSGALGEAGLQSLFDALPRAKREAVAEGWDGDRFVFYEGPQGRTLLAWWTVWDDEEEARAFREAIEHLSQGPLSGKEGSRRIDAAGRRVTLFVGSEEAVAQAAGVGQGK